MNSREITYEKVISELNQYADAGPDMNNGICDIVSAITEASKIFIIGLGHIGLISRILTMKINHLGLRAFDIFDTINPPMERGDLLIVFSESGQTSTAVTIAEKCRNLGGTVISVTQQAHSKLGDISDRIVVLKKPTADTGIEVSKGVFFNLGDLSNQNTLGAIFSYRVYAMIYAIIIQLITQLDETPESVNARHANLQ